MYTSRTEEKRGKMFKLQAMLIQLVLRWIWNSISDPLFWMVLVVLTPISGFLFLLIGYTCLGLVLGVLSTFGVIALVRSLGSSASVLYHGTGPHKTEKEGRREFDYEMNIYRERLCEREGRYTEAIRFYTAVLEMDDRNIEALFSIARISHRQLKKDRNGKVMVPQGAQDHRYETSILEGCA